MSKSEQEIVTDKIVSTARTLEELGFDYSVTGPKQDRKKGNQYLRIVTIQIGDGQVIAFYNPAKGRTFASDKSGVIRGVKSIEDLAKHLKKLRRR